MHVGVLKMCLDSPDWQAGSCCLNASRFSARSRQEAAQRVWQIRLKQWRAACHAASAARMRRSLPPHAAGARRPA